MKRWSWMAGALGLLLLAGAVPAAADNDSDGYYGHGPYGRYRMRHGAENTFRLRLGVFTPSGGEEYFHESEREFTGKASDLQDANFGLDWMWNLTPNVGLMLSGDYFQGKNDMSYRNFVDENGNEIFHTTTLESAPVTLGVVVQLAPEGFPVQPYVGAGGGAYFWRLQESGDFIDFNAGRQVFSDTFTNSGTTFGWYGMVGLDVPVSNEFSVFGEARWDQARANLTGDFAGLGKLDLSGRRVMGGVAWRF